MIGFRISLNLLYNATFGVFIQMTGRMVKDTFKFLFIYFLFLILYSAVGYVMFADIEAYKTFEDTLLTMYDAGLGGYDFGAYDDSGLTHSTIGKIYLFVYLLVSLILLLNLLIAILSDSYAAMTEKSVGLRVVSTIRLRVIHAEHKYYSCLSKTTLLNGWFIFLMLPIILVAKSEKLNKIILRFEFI